ncbi:uncharacterized protein LOC132254848 [Vitis vinifera]|uniref:uncharacterized protein LOC132254848 n=1 Tax=Vitis vinifera TaxID=29760 RepID=UPI00015CC9A6
MLLLIHSVSVLLLSQSIGNPWLKIWTYPLELKLNTTIKTTGFIAGKVFDLQLGRTWMDFDFPMDTDVTATTPTADENQKQSSDTDAGQEAGQSEADAEAEAGMIDGETDAEVDLDAVG